MVKIIYNNNTNNYTSPEPIPKYICHFYGKCRCIWLQRTIDKAVKAVNERPMQNCLFCKRVYSVFETIIIGTPLTGVLLI